MANWHIWDISFTKQPCQRSNLANSLLRPKRPVLQDAVDGAHAVLPADFFAFFKGASVVADSDLIDTDFGHAGDFGSDFGLESEAIFAQLEWLNEVAAKELVAGLHVGKVQVGEHIGQEGEEFIAQRMPEK